MQSFTHLNSCNHSFIWIHAIIHSFEFMQSFIHSNSCNHSFIRIHAIIRSFEFMSSFIHSNSCNHSFIWIHIITHSFEFMRSLIYLNSCNHSRHSRWFISESMLHSVWSLIFLTVESTVFADVLDKCCSQNSVVWIDQLRLASWHSHTSFASIACMLQKQRDFRAMNDSHSYIFQ